MATEILQRQYGAIAELGTDIWGVKRVDLKERFIRSHREDSDKPDAKPDSSRKSFDRALKWLQDHGLYTQFDGYIWAGGPL